MKNLVVLVSLLFMFAACGMRSHEEEKEVYINEEGEELILEEPDDPVVDTPEDLGGEVVIEGAGEEEEIEGEEPPEE